MKPKDKDSNKFNPEHESPEYKWLIDRQLVGFEPHTQLQPWYFTQGSQSFCATEMWPGVCEEDLYVFARRQGSDDLACFAVKDAKIMGIYVIEGWFGESFFILEKFNTIWDWLKYAIDDVADWAAVVHEHAQKSKNDPL